MDSHVSFISGDKFSANIVENIEISAPNMMVQETTTHSFIFTTRSILPGTQNAGNPDETIVPAIHIYFPPTFELDTNNLASDAITISGTDVVISGNPTFTRDTSATYMPDC